MRTASTATSRTLEDSLLACLIFDPSVKRPFRFVLEEGNGRSSGGVFQTKISVNQFGIAETGSGENMVERARAIWREVLCPVPRTTLGRKLWAIRRRIVASGTPLLGWEEIGREIAARRGERE